MDSRAPVSPASATPLSSAARAFSEPSTGTRICLNIAALSLREGQVTQEERNLGEKYQRHRNGQKDRDERRRASNDLDIGPFEHRDGRKYIASERRRG